MRKIFIILLFPLFCHAQQDSSIVFNQSVKNWLDSLHGTEWVQTIINYTHNDFEPILITDTARDSVVYMNGRAIDTTAMLYMMPKANLENADFGEMLYFITQQPIYRMFSMKMITIIYKKQQF
jgi:hypothetical protein